MPGTLLTDLLYVAAPLLVQYAASFLFYTCFPRADAALLVLLTGLACLPVLAFWRHKDRAGSGRGRGQGAARPFRAAKRQRWLQAALGLFCLAAGAVLSWLSAILMEKAGIYARYSNAAQEAYLRSSYAWLLLGPGLVSPLAEELAYRGLFYPRMERMIERTIGMPGRKRTAEAGRAPALVSACITSLLFALGHGNMIQFLYAFPMGLLLCTLCDRAQMGLLPPVLLHLGANLYAVLAARPGG